MIKSKHTTMVKPGIILLGFITISIQIILLREFLTLFSGNELVIGIILTNWMILTGLGAYIGRFVGKTRNNIDLILVFISIITYLPILTVYFIHYVWYTFFPPGIMAGIIPVFFYSLLFLAPFCVISGVLFTQFARFESVKYAKNKIGIVYAWESLGSLLGGLIFNFLLIWLSTTFQSLFLLMIVSVLTIFYLGIKSDNYLLAGIVLIISFVFGYYFMNVDLDKKVREFAFQSQEIHYSNDSPFGIFVITKHGNQVNYYENNILMASSGDITTKEESVHFTMVQHNNPKNVLILSGIISGIIDEVNKYPIDNIDYVDANPEIFRIVKQAFNIEIYKNLNLIKNDPVRYLKSTDKKYDIVLINLPKPTTIQLNRYYTQEFFQLLKQRMQENALVSITLPSSADYLNDEALEFFSILYKTLSTKFENVEIMPAGNDYMIASEHNIYFNITERIEILNIQTLYVNAFYFDDELLETRANQIKSQLDQTVLINKDFNPSFYHSQLKLWMSHFNIKYWIPAIIILIFSGFFFFRSDYIKKSVFAAGFAGTSIEIILLLVFQVLFGYVYVAVGVIIMIFMGGLAFGAFYIHKIVKDFTLVNLKYLLISVIVLSFVLPCIFLLLQKVELNNSTLFTIFALLIFITSTIVGAIFSISSNLLQKEYGLIASDTYGMDLLGAAAGAILFTIYLIPIMGFIWSVLITGIFTLILVLLGNRKGFP